MDQMPPSQLRINDRRGDTLIPLGRIFEWVAEAAPNALTCDWLVRGEGTGHGSFVVAVERGLESHDYVRVAGADLYRALVSEDQNFWDVRLGQCQRPWLQAGVFDATFHYVIGPDRIIRSLSRRFDSIDWQDDLIHLPGVFDASELRAACGDSSSGTLGGCV